MRGILALRWELLLLGIATLLMLGVPALLLLREATLRRALIATLRRALITTLRRTVITALLEMRWWRSSEALTRGWEALLLTEALIAVRHEGYKILEKEGCGCWSEEYVNCSNARSGVALNILLVTLVFHCDRRLRLLSAYELEG